MKNQTTSQKPAFITLSIRCEHHVKKFLENNFGSPVSIPSKHVLNKLISSQLGKKNTRTNNVKDYNSEVLYNINECSFRYDGFYLNDQNTRSFNTSVDNYIKSLSRTNLDSLLFAQASQTMWKNKFTELMQNLKIKLDDRQVQTMIREMKQELEAFEVTIQQAIDILMKDTLRLTYDDLPFETIKKDYYRYRMKKINPEATIN